MLKVRCSAKLKKDFKAIIKRGYNISLFEEVITLLCKGEVQYCEYALKDEYMGHRVCYILPDWLLIYKIENDLITLSLTRTGTHSDLF